MSNRPRAQEWFVPGDGIERQIISTDIQRYLGNDATVRPGQGPHPDTGAQVPGYIVKAYRNLTTAMIQDLRKDSASWRQERRMGSRGTNEPSAYHDSRFAEPDARSAADSYVGSTTYYQSTANRAAGTRRDGDSPRAPEHGAPASSRDRVPARGMPVDRDRMDMDPPQPPRAGGGYGQPDPRAYQPDGRAFAPDGRSYQPEQPPVGPGYPSWPPVTSGSYGQNGPGYVQSNYPPQLPPGEVPPGMMRQGAYYVPIPGYEAIPSAPSRSDSQPYGANGAYGQPPPAPQGRDPRYGQQDYSDPRYAYPSPAATVQSMSRDREPVTSPSHPSMYPTAPPSSQYDQYGRPQEPSAQRQPDMYGTTSREPAHGRDRDRERERARERERERESERDSRQRPPPSTSDRETRRRLR